MRRLLTLAVRVELFGEVADAGLLGFAGGGEGESVRKQVVFIDVGSLPTPSRPPAMPKRWRGRCSTDAEHVGIGAAYDVQFVIRTEWQCLITEHPVFRRFRWRCSYSDRPIATQVPHRLAENPPVLSPRFAVIVVALGLTRSSSH